MYSLDGAGKKLCLEGLEAVNVIWLEAIFHTWLSVRQIESRVRLVDDSTGAARPCVRVGLMFNLQPYTVRVGVATPTLDADFVCLTDVHMNQYCILWLQSLLRKFALFVDERTLNTANRTFQWQLSSPFRQHPTLVLVASDALASFESHIKFSTNINVTSSPSICFRFKLNETLRNIKMDRSSVQAITWYQWSKL